MNENMITNIIKLSQAIAEGIIAVLSKLVDVVLKHLLLVTVVSILTSLIIYVWTPEIVFMTLHYLNLTNKDFSTIRDLTSRSKEQASALLEIQKQVDLLHKSKIDLEYKLGEALGEKQGLLESIKHYNKNNWWIIIGTTALVTVVGGCVAYWLISGDDGAFFKPITELISKNTATSIQANHGIGKSLGTGINALSQKLMDLNIEIAAIKSALASLQVDLDHLNKK